MCIKVRVRAIAICLSRRSCSRPCASIGDGEEAEVSVPKPGYRGVRASPSPIRSCGMPATSSANEGSRSGSGRTRCATVSRPTCWRPEPTCARSSYCWDTRTQRYHHLPACIPQPSAGRDQSAGSDLGCGSQLLPKDDRYFLGRMKRPPWEVADVIHRAAVDF